MKKRVYPVVEEEYAIFEPESLNPRDDASHIYMMLKKMPHTSKKVEMDLRGLSIGGNGKHYSFECLSKKLITAGEYSFYEYSFHVEDGCSSGIEGVYFESRDINTRKKHFLFFERVKVNDKGNFKIHILIDPINESKSMMVMIKDIVEKVSETIESQSRVRTEIKNLKKRIERLSNISDISLVPPCETDQFIMVPINCSYSKNCFAKLFLLKDHVVISQIISQAGLIQFQIPIKKENEELLLLVYGGYYLRDLYTEPKEEIGRTLITGGKAYYESYSSILKSLGLIKKEIEVDRCSQEILDDYYDAIKLLKKWMQNNLNMAYQELMRLFPVPKWKNEFRLYQFIKLLFPDACYQYRDEWLGSQSIDIFIPTKRFAIEYQGEQHFEASDYFGGKEKLFENQQRDKDKRDKCKANNVTLYEWEYKDSVTYGNVEMFVRRFFPEIQMDYNSVCSFLLNGIPFKIDNFLIENFLNDNNVESAEIDNEYHPDYLIRQYGESGEFISEFVSIKEAADSIGVGVSSIYKCITGQRKHAGGYRWTREEYNSVPLKLEKEDIELTSSAINDGKPKSVIQIDMETGEVLKVFESIGSASNEVGINRKGISDVLAGRQKSAGGYYWEWNNE